MMPLHAEVRCKYRLITQQLHPLVLGDMNATVCDNDRTSGATYPSDRMHRSFLSSNNLSPC